MKCFLCQSSNVAQKYIYGPGTFSQESKEYFQNVKILTCDDCQISFCENIRRENLDKYYEKTQKKIQEVSNRFKEFNSRFFTQVLYFINHANLKKDINVLEVGPNNLGILPTLKIFQKKIKYYYFDQVELKHDHKEIFKLGNYFSPENKNLPMVDLIWMSHSLEHIFPDDLIKVLSSFYKALNKNGKIFIEIPNDIKMKTFNVPHTLFFNKKSLAKLFGQLNFKIIAYSEINSSEEYNMENRSIKENKDSSSKIPLINKIYLFLQKFLPDYFVKKFAFKNFVLNGPYTNLPIIRLIVEKKDL